VLDDLAKAWQIPILVSLSSAIRLYRQRGGGLVEALAQASEALSNEQLQALRASAARKTLFGMAPVAVFDIPAMFFMLLFPAAARVATMVTGS
jgi:hypothetical protein